MKEKRIREKGKKYMGTGGLGGREDEKGKKEDEKEEFNSLQREFILLSLYPTSIKLYILLSIIYY